MKILLVDDDPAIVQLLLQFLKADSHYDTTVACNGAFAIKNATAAGGVDLLITDVVMDPMDGFTLNRQLRESYPTMKTIFISGYDLSSYAGETAECTVLVKPVDAETLLEAIAQTMAAGGQAQPTAPAPAAQSIDDPGPAATIGSYKVIRRISESEWGPVYLAVQTSMDRPVAMKVLSEEAVRNDPEAKQRFLASARAQASVKHAAILSVYEAGEADCRTFYTYEYVEGPSLEELVQGEQKIDDQLALRIVKVVAQGLSYLDRQGIAHEGVAAGQIFIGKDGVPHLGNPAVDGEGEGDVQRDTAALARIIALLLPDGTPDDSGLKQMLAKMATEVGDAYRSWSGVEEAAKLLEPKVIPADAIKLTAREHAAIRAVDQARRQHNRSLALSAAGLFALLCLVVGTIWWNVRGNDLDDMVHIPAGEFVYQAGQKAVTGEFWIDKYEVTIEQYARFLAALKANPTTQFDSPNQPKGKLHIPKDNTTWQIYYGRACAGKPVHGVVAINLTCPVFNVDYWDACAYAKWVGKRLPTEQEWEKAGRGLNGFQYPWGNEFDPKKANSGADYIQHPGPGDMPKAGGYFWWTPVDALKGDKSPFGVMGMAGNVAEWTDSWDPEHKHPVIRGGSFHSTKPANATNDVKITQRTTDADPENFSEFVGFRCVSDYPPKK